MNTEQSHTASWHDLLNILDLVTLEDQDWIDDTSSEDENEEITKAIVQPNQFCQPCWYWLDLIVKTNKNQVVYSSEV